MAGSMHYPGTPTVSGVPYDDPIFVKAARWLLDQSGIEQLCVFTQDSEFPGVSFIPVDPQRLDGGTELIG